MPHAGKIACIDLGAFQVRLKVSADGMCENVDAQPASTPVLADAEVNSVNVTALSPHHNLSAADVTIRVKLADLPLILQQPERAFSYVKIEGDADFANTISQLSKTVRWEAEEDLSKLVGDIAAVRIVAGARQIVQSAKDTHQKIQENLAEYFLEENPMLVRPARVKEFGNEVNKLRDDVERLTKRLDKYARTQGC